MAVTLFPAEQRHVCMSIRQDLYSYLSEHLRQVKPADPKGVYFSMHMGDGDGGPDPFLVHVRGPDLTPVPVQVWAYMIASYDPKREDSSLAIQFVYEIPEEERKKGPWLAENPGEISKPFRAVLHDLANRAGLHSQFLHEHPGHVIADYKAAPAGEALHE